MISKLSPILDALLELERKLGRTPAPEKVLPSLAVTDLAERNVLEAEAVPDHLSIGRQWMLRLWRRARQDQWLDEVYATAIAPLWCVLGNSATGQWDLLRNHAHPLNLLLEQLLSIGRSFQPAPAGAEFLTVLSARMQQLAGAPESALQDELHAIHDLLTRMRDQQHQSDRALLSKEMQAVRSTHVHSAVSRALRYAMLGKNVPERILRFVDQVWRKYLSVLYLRNGMENPEWQRALSDIDMLIWLNDSASIDEVKTAMNAEVAGLLSRLQVASKSVRGVDAEVESFRDWFANRMAERVSGESLTVDFGFGAFDYENEVKPQAAFGASEASDEEALAEALRTLLPNDAVRLRTFEGWKRARIVEVDLAHDLILIADCYGLRLAALGRRELAASIVAGKVELLPRGSLHVAVEDEIEQWLRALESCWQNEHLSRLDAQRRQQEIEMLRELEARRADEAERRARALADARAREARTQQEREAGEKARRLRAGAVLQIANEDGKLRPAFLAMISGSNGEYVFVDRNGQKLASWSLEKVAQAMVDGRMQVLESGSALDATLSGLVKDRRQYLREESL